jgi:nucleoside 2-deoxyribosyltransferase/predicted secreted protein
MYVLMCPCILDPSIRARGITREEDLAAFQRAIERCRRFNIEVVTLPCPETRFLGKEREPGTYLGRLDTPEFARLQEGLLAGVRKIISDREPPHCIVGVDSSPTCGITATWYGSAGGEPAKRPGRGTFLAGLAEIPAIDVKAFARYRIYLAAPLFSEAEKTFNLQLHSLLTDHFFEVYLPQLVGDDTHTRNRKVHRQIFKKHLQALQRADRVVAVIDGADADSGTAWEMGYAFGIGKEVIAIRTDFRRVGLHEQVNLMLEQSSAVVGMTDELVRVLSSPRCIGKSDRR